MTTLKNKFKKIKIVVSIAETIEKLKAGANLVTENKEVLDISELLLLQINSGENEILFI